MIFKGSGQGHVVLRMVLLFAILQSLMLMLICTVHGPSPCKLAISSGDEERKHANKGAMMELSAS
jgi:hypothetical protein